MGGRPLVAPIVAMSPTADGGGYWEVAADGGVFAFGDARFSGSMGGRPLDAPIVAMAPTPDGGGYWLVAADGGVFAFGDARFSGVHGRPAAQPADRGHGHRPVDRRLLAGGADGGVFAFDAPYFGSTGSLHLNAPITSAATSGGGTGVPGWPPPTGGSSPSAPLPSTARWAAATSTSRSPPSPRPRTDRATGRPPPTGGSSPSAALPFEGSMAGTHLVAPVVGLARADTAADGGSRLAP